MRLKCSTAVEGKGLSTAETQPSREEARPQLWEETLVNSGLSPWNRPTEKKEFHI